MGRVRAGRCRECFSGLLSGGTGGRPAFRILGHRSFFRAALYITFFIRIIRASLPQKEKWKFTRYIILPNLVFLLSGLPENIAPVRIPEAVSMSGIITQRTVKDIIGHTNAALTIRQYVHSDMDTKPAGLKAIENIV